MLVALFGGPFDGEVVEASGRVPLIMATVPRQRTLLDEPAARAAWVPDCRWYAVGVAEPGPDAPRLCQHGVPFADFCPRCGA